MEDKFSLSLEQNMFLAKKQLVSSIYSGAKIEGLNVTFPETQTILDGVNVGSVPLDEIQAILNLRNSWRYTLQNIDKPFDLDFACHVNGEVAREESLEWGKLRTGTVGIGGTDYKPSIPAEEQVKQDIENILSHGSATDKAINYFLYGCRNQLFWDGNKRTSSICANKILISNGAGIMTVPEKHLAEFNTKLTAFYETNEPQEMSQFLYEKCITGMELQQTRKNPIQKYCNSITKQAGKTLDKSREKGGHQRGL